MAVFVAAAVFVVVGIDVVVDDVVVEELYIFVENGFVGCRT